ncbi:MAG TPA: SCO family protein [Nocardioidaceae bacterium]|nr:SCO family protein [Nocardioidaceae bacterium]
MRRSVLAATLLFVLAACGGDPATTFRENNPDGFAGAVLADKYQLTPVVLTDDDGQNYRLTDRTTKPLTLIFFGYTQCPDICQVIMNDIAAAVARLDGADRLNVGMLFISTDPATDDPATLKRYLGRFNPEFVGLTGSLEDIKAVGSTVGVEIGKGDRLPSGGYAVSHGTQILGALPGGSVPIVWTDGTTSAELSEDITKALHDGFAKVGSDS